MKTLEKNIPAKSNTKKSSVFFQPKLTINQPNDIYEQEADAVAELVMRMPVNKNENTFFKPVSINSIQRKCAECEEEELQRKEDEDEEQSILLKPAKEFDVQKKCAHCEEEEKLQLKSQSNDSTRMTAPSIVHDVINSRGKSMDTGTKSFMESRFGYDFGNVQIHNDSLAHQSSADINALAYTYGNHVVFNQNQYSPETDRGKRLLAHELTHVVQQNGNINRLIQRTTLIEEPAGGCGICYGTPAAVGNAAHKLIQTEFEIGAGLSGLVEFPFSSPDDENGRLDLAIATLLGFEIGEIKPANTQNYISGAKDIAFYIVELSKTYPDSTIDLLETVILHPIDFPTGSPNCLVQTLYVNPPVGGVYGYYCEPTYSELRAIGCKCSGRKSKDQKAKAKDQSQVAYRSTQKVGTHSDFINLASSIQDFQAPVDSEFVIALSGDLFTDIVKEAAKIRLQQQTRVMQIDPRSVPIIQVGLPLLPIAAFAAISEIFIFFALTLPAIGVALEASAAAAFAAASSAAASATAASAVGSTVATTTVISGATITSIHAGATAAAVTTATTPSVVVTMGKAATVVLAAGLVTNHGISKAEANEAVKPFVGKRIFSIVDVTNDDSIIPGSAITVDGQTFNAIIKLSTF